MTAFLLATFLTLAETPEKTVQAFVDAFNARDSAAMSREVQGGKAESMPSIGGYPKLKVTLGASKIDGDKATVEADVELSDATSRVQRAHETIELRRQGGSWAIVPSEPKMGGPQEMRFVSILAYIASHPETMALARTAAKKTACLSNVKQLALGTIMYSGDHNDVLPKSANWKSSIMPYVKYEAIFHCPEDKTGSVSYFLDPRVSGKPFVAIAYPAETAMIVEGTPKKTAFRHGGMASLGFVDGHAKVVKPDSMLKARTKSLKQSK